MEIYEYGKRWEEFHAIKTELLDRRATLENELNDVTVRLTHIDEILDHLAPLAGVVMAPNSVAGLGITDAIRTVLREAKEAMSAQDLRRLLKEQGFDFSNISAPMASIYKILSRLVDSEDLERQKTDDGRVVFAWKTSPTEIADDDIPF